MSGKAAFGAWPMRGFSVASVRWPVRGRRTFGLNVMIASRTYCCYHNRFGLLTDESCLYCGELCDSNLPEMPM